jgi:dGTPase
VVSWADRIAYVCHDFEDAVSAGVVSAADLPPSVAERCGVTRGAQLGAFMRDIVLTTLASGRVGMGIELADALATFRACNYERIYLRPESVEQAAAVHRLLRALVDHLVAHPALLPRPDEDPVRAAVTYVAGMTDRYAVAMAERWLGWDRRSLQLHVA